MSTRVGRTSSDRRPRVTSRTASRCRVAAWARAISAAPERAGSGSPKRASRGAAHRRRGPARRRAPPRNGSRPAERRGTREGDRPGTGGDQPEPLQPGHGGRPVVNLHADGYPLPRLRQRGQREHARPDPGSTDTAPGAAGPRHVDACARVARRTSGTATRIPAAIRAVPSSPSRRYGWPAANNTSRTPMQFRPYGHPVTCRIPVIVTNPRARGVSPVAPTPAARAETS